MSERTVAWVMMAIAGAQVILLLALVIDIDGPLSNRPARPRKNRKLFGIVGVLMTALDDALARFTAFVKAVSDQLKGAADTNETQTGKIAELQTALDAALSDDAADKAAIAALQAEINTLQDEVAAQINSAIDALANPLPVVDPIEPPVTPDITVPPIVNLDESAGDGSAVVVETTTDTGAVE